MKDRIKSNEFSGGVNMGLGSALRRAAAAAAALAVCAVPAASEFSDGIMIYDTSLTAQAASVSDP